MGQGSSNIRTQVEETPTRVGDDPGAVGYSTTDAPRSPGQYIGGRAETSTGRMGSVKHAVSGGTMRPGGGGVARLKDAAQRNPIGLAVGGVAVGFVTGLVLPSTKLENEKMGEVSDRVVDAVKETAGDAVESAKQVAHDTAGSAQEQGRDLASTLQERTGESLTSAPSAGGPAH